MQGRLYVKVAHCNFCIGSIRAGNGNERDACNAINLFTYTLHAL